MNALDTSVSIDAERPEEDVAGPREIKKYPNRRLYDTVQSRYITLADVRELVMQNIDFVVIDKKSQRDITRCILLQVICEQEQTGQSLLSHDFLAQVIRSHGSAMHGVVGSYLEQSLKLLSLQQPQLRQHMQQILSDEACQHIAALTEQNLERWRAVQAQIFRAMTQQDAPPPRSSAVAHQEGDTDYPLRQAQG